MDPKEKLFRKAALEKMASPERLDEMMEVTAPAGWLALGGLGLILATAIFWGIFGEVSIKVQGNGILLRGEAVLDVSAGSSGRLHEIVVRPGDILQENDVVATVRQADLELQIENTREEVEALLVQTEDQSESSGRILAQLQSQRRDIQSKISSQESMVSRGLLTRGTLLNTKAQLAAVDQQIAQQESGQSARTNRLDDVRRDLEQLESRLEATSKVVSPYRGRVLELMIDPGNLVGPGTRLVTLEALVGSIDAVIYVSAADGKKIHEGMDVRVSPSTIRSEEYGFILGVVKTVSDYPVTPEGMLRVLRNEQLVRSLTGEGPKIEVVVALTEDPTTPSGFAWSSSSGPPTQVYTGTIALGNVLVEKKKPLSYVLPIFRRAMGAG